MDIQVGGQPPSKEGPGNRNPKYDELRVVVLSGAHVEVAEAVAEKI